MQQADTSSVGAEEAPLCSGYVVGALVHYSSRQGEDGHAAFAGIP